MKESSI